MNWKYLIRDSFIISLVITVLSTAAVYSGIDLPPSYYQNGSYGFYLPIYLLQSLHMMLFWVFPFAPDIPFFSERVSFAIFSPLMNLLWLWILFFVILDITRFYISMFNRSTNASSH